MTRLEEIAKRRKQIKRSYDYKADEVERLQKEMDQLNDESVRLIEEASKITAVSDEDIIEANRREPSSAAARVFEMLDAARLSDKERVADAALKLAESKP